MKIQLIILLTYTFMVSLSWLSGKATDKDFYSTNSANVRVIRHEDGSRSIFNRDLDDKILKKKTFSANGELQLVTVYRLRANGDPYFCKIYNSKNEELFKFSYGFNKTTNQLEQELMFDSRNKRIDPKTNKEMPIRVFMYTYDAMGKRGKPIAITLIQGKSIEDVLKDRAAGPSAYDKDLFNK